jgi:alpha-tubulin suppressor-like RCC1 family protein
MLILALTCACAADGETGPDGSTVTVRVDPASLTLASLGANGQLTATARDAGGRPVSGRVFSWSSSQTAVATVSPAGVVTAVTNGSTEVRAAADGVTGSATVIVAQAVATARMKQDSVSLAVGASLRLEAEAADAMGHVMTGAAFTWSTSSASVAAVDVAGVVTALSPGNAVVSATSQGVTAMATVVVGPTFEFSVVSADGHSCALTPAGTAYCWGSNSWGELGSAVGFSSRVAAPVQGGHVFRSISSGTRLTCGVTTAGEGLCWGRDEAGRLGRGTTPAPDLCSVPPTFAPEPCAKAPGLVAGDHRFTMISTGTRHACGIAVDGRALCWGLNDRGQLGIGTTIGPAVCAGGVPCSPEPVAVAGGLVFESISVGLDHACALTPAGDAYCWGWNNGATLGDGTGTPRSAPVRVAGGHSYASVTAGFNHTCGLTDGGAAYCWGVNQEGQLGAPGVVHGIVPTPVAGGLVFASADTRCGVTHDGTGYCWGPNRFGQLGVGTTAGPEQCTYACSRTPMPVTGGLVFRTVSSGRTAQTHTCGVTTDGAVYCWGYNSSGALGNGTTEDSPTPFPIRVPQ